LTEESKKAAAEKALELVQDGMLLGLGSGSTAKYFTEGVGRLVAGGMKLRGVPTSRATAELAAEHGITIVQELVGPIDLALRAYARQQPGCRTLIDQIYGVGPLTSVAILTELGDTRRFQNSRDAVRYAGLDITVYQSDTRRSAGHLSRQGPPALRWALYEAAQAARRPSSSERPYYDQLAARIGGNRACIAVARKLLKRSYHLLRALGDQGLEPVAT